MKGGSRRRWKKAFMPQNLTIPDSEGSAQAGEPEV